MSQIYVGSAVVVCEGEELHLRASKMVWWPADNCLFMADSHFGKAATFRNAGLPVPSGTTAAMLKLLSAEVEVTKAQKLIVLGDFVHSAVSGRADFEDELRSWRVAHAELDIQIVQGNHDLRPKSFYDGLSLQLITEKEFSYKCFTLCHRPEDNSGRGFCLCGHLHPSLNLSGVHEKALPCFLLNDRHLILPAFGHFTGTKRIHLELKDSAFAVCEDRILKVDKLSLPTYQGRNFQPQKKPTPNSTPATTPGRLRQ